jgi:hypothetical protein
MPMQFEARKVALKQDRTGFVLTLSVHPDEFPAELLRDFVGARYACVMVRINDDETPVAYNNRVQKAAMLCKNPSFQQLLGTKGEDATAKALCDRLGIDSRTELNGNSLAQSLFDDLVAEFENEAF